MVLTLKGILGNSSLTYNNNYKQSIATLGNSLRVLNYIGIFKLLKLPFAETLIENNNKQHFYY